MAEIKKFSLVKPTTDTPFAIDFEWWKTHDNNWRVFLIGYLCAEHASVYSDKNEDELMDWVDIETGEVQTVDGLLHVVITHCSKQPDFLNNNTALVDSVFRTLLANNNKMMTPSELAEPTGKPAEVILRTLAGPQVYKGIRPIHNL